MKRKSDRNGLTAAQIDNGDKPLSGPLRERITTLLGDVSDRTSVGDLRQILVTRGEHAWRRLAQVLLEACQDSRALETESSRVLIARLTAASLPRSRSVLETILETPARSDAHAELQFSLFVAFSDLPQQLASADLAFVLEQVEHFLESVDSDVAQAAWMGGDLLGDHWPLEEGIPSLLRLARTAKHPAGREAAIHGLSHALNRAPKARQWDIISALKEIAATDRTSSVRNYADSVMGQLRGL